jgi:anti-repressor protein
MNELQKVFNYQGIKLRTVIKDGEPWWVAKDVCQILDLEQITRAMDRLEDDERGLLKVTHPQNANLFLEVNGVNEPGLYQLIIASNKPEAKEFKRWITHEVIPQIRKTGSYSIKKQSTTELIAAGYQAALQLIEDMKPKAASFDSLISADGLYTISDAAKILNYENAGPKKIFKILESEGFLFYKAGWYAYQLYINDGYFVTKTRKVNFGDCNPDIYNQVFVTPKGLDMLDKHFGRNGFKKMEVKS